MKCNGCGTEYPEVFARCPSCSAPNPTRQAPPQPQFTRPPYPTAIELIKQVGHHKLYLPTCITMTVGVALSAIFSGIDVLSILMVVALWLFYAESKKNADPYKMDLTSLKMLSVVKTIQLVVYWIVVGILAICLPLIGGVASIAAAEGGDIVGAISGIAAIIVLVAIAICGGALALAIIQTAGLRKFYKSAIESAESGLRPKKLSKAAPILMMISGGLGLVYNIIAMFSMGLFKELIFEELMSQMYYEFSYEMMDSILAYSGSSVVVMFIAGLAIYVAQIMAAKILLDAKALSDNSYYPNPEEAFYNKQMYYGPSPIPFANSYAYQQPPQYQPPQYQPPQYQAPQYQAPQYQPTQTHQAPIQPTAQPTEQTQPQSVEAPAERSTAQPTSNGTDENDNKVDS